MDPTRILPDLQCSLLCEEVRQEINRNLMFIGVIEAVFVPQLPVTAVQLCVVNRWTAGVGNFQESVRLVAPDQSTVMRQSQVKFALPQPVQSRTNVSVFGQVSFEKAGIYYVEVLVDDVMKIRYPVPVLLVKQPAGAAPSGGAAAPPAASKPADPAEPAPPEAPTPT